MPIDFRCTHCSALLRVPDESVGKQAKCPKCQNVVTITAATGPTPAAPSPSPDLPTGDLFAKSSSPASADPSASLGTMPTLPTAGMPYGGQQPASFGTPYSDPQSAPYSGQYNAPYAPATGGAANPYQAPASYNQSTGWGMMTASRESVVAKVKPPAIGLMIYAGLSLVFLVINVISSFLNPNGITRIMQNAQNDAERLGGVIGLVLVIVVTIIPAVLIFIGAPKMMNLQSRGLALTAAIAGCVPCNLCCLLGLPIGIWSIVVLLQPDVKAWFSMSQQSGMMGASAYGGPRY